MPQSLSSLSKQYVQFSVTPSVRCFFDRTRKYLVLNAQCQVILRRRLSIRHDKISREYKITSYLVTLYFEDIKKCPWACAQICATSQRGQHGYYMARLVYHLVVSLFVAPHSTYNLS